MSLHSTSTKIHKKLGVRVDKKTQTTYLIKNNTQIAYFYAINPVQFTFIKPVDTAILGLNLEGDPDLTFHMNHVYTTGEPEQRNNIFWFQTPKKPSKIEDFKPIQTRILKKKHMNWKKKVTFCPKDDADSETHFLERFDWYDNLFTEANKQGVKDILVEYNHLFARHRNDIGMNTQFKVEVTPQDDKAVFRQKLLSPFHLKESLIVQIAQMHR